MFNLKGSTYETIKQYIDKKTICVLKDDLDAVFQKLSEFYIYDINIMYMGPAYGYTITFKAPETTAAIVMKQLKDLVVELTEETTQTEKTVEKK